MITREYDGEQVALTVDEIAYAIALIESSPRFWEKVERGKPGECWPWVSPSVNRDGYGLFHFQGRYVIASRHAWELEHQERVPDGLLVCHKCDAPPCCNPECLFLGTVQDNVDDRVAKGRSRK